jgi:putative endonuclease
VALNIQTGRYGESLATRYLILKDFEIIECNWRYKRLEIDIIAFKNNTIHFIEVKTRHSLSFGHPEESVTRRKFNNLRKCATAFLLAFKDLKKIQFDILSITMLPGKEIEYYLIEDFYIY